MCIITSSSKISKPIHCPHQTPQTTQLTSSFDVNRVTIQTINAQTVTSLSLPLPLSLSHSPITQSTHPSIDPSDPSHSNNPTTLPIRPSNRTATPTHLTRPARKARPNIQCRIPQKEIPRPQQHTHRLSRHNRPILRRRHMRQAKRVPKHHIFLLNPPFGILSNPGHQIGVNCVGLPAGLRHVAAGGM